MSTPNKENVAPTKRLLNTPQENSPCRKAVRVNSPASKLSSRKSLSFAIQEITDEERLDAALHVENWPDEGNLQVKVAFVANSDLIARIPRDMPSKLLVKQLALKKIGFKHNITAQGAFRRSPRQNPQRDVEGTQRVS